MRHLLSCGALCALLTVPALAQAPVRPFPLDVGEVDDALDALVLHPRHAELRELARLERVLLQDALLPDGRLVDLDLERISIARRKFRLLVDGVERADLLAQPSLSLWKGSVVGAPDSSVMLGFSEHGCRGWIRLGEDGLVHLMPRPDAAGDWARGDALFVSERALNVRGFVLRADCTELPTTGTLEPLTSSAPAGGGWTDMAGSCSLREAKIAIESDYQLYQVFGDLNAMTSYVTTLLGFVSDRYESQVSTVLTFPYMQFYTTANDPWTAQDGGGSCIDVLNEFRAAWVGNVPGGADLGHFLSGANLGCGVAWLDVLCNDQYNFSVSGNINGDVNFPVVQQPNNWDFMVVAHELGHNFASPHTHDYCPPLDECPSSQYWGQCQDEQICLTNGTIMSYCHLCPGGTGNITTFFHPTAAAVMTNAAASCLPAFFDAEADAPSILVPDVATPVTLTTSSTVTGNVELHYDYGAGYASVVLADQGGGVYSGALPAASCGASAQYYYAYTDAGCGAVTLPSGAPGTTYSALVGNATLALADDFESDQGWTTENLGASSGDWQRGVPVNDGGWAYDPPADSDGSGSAYLTQNQDGNTDVDGGAVRLTSPFMDLSGGEVLVTYDYYLRLTNENGADMLLVEGSADGATWTEIARHDTDGGTSWRSNALGTADFTSAGLVPSATTWLRFTANDADPQSIVEAGVDAFAATVLTCGGGGLGTSYCGPAVPNSTGNSASITATGSAVALDNDLSLTASDVPNGEFLYFLASMTQDFNANPAGSQGVLCVGGNIARFTTQVGQVAGNQFSIDVDTQSVPQNPNGPIVAGETWNFTCWFRDQNPGSTSNFSDGYSILFQ
jgi:hypothetical protein